MAEGIKEVQSDLRAASVKLRKVLRIEGQEIKHPGASRYSYTAAYGDLLRLIRYYEDYLPVGHDGRGVRVKRDLPTGAAA